MNVVEKLRVTVRAALGLPQDPGAPPDIMRLGLYRATVVACAADGSTYDVQPEDPRIPAAKQVPVRVGIPGAFVVIQPNAIVLLGWEKGDPSKPYCSPSYESGAKVIKVEMDAATLRLIANSTTFEVDAAAGITMNGGVLPVGRQTDPVTGTAGPYPLASGMIAGGAPKVKA